jgi:hypothetical protein
MSAGSIGLADSSIMAFEDEGVIVGRMRTEIGVFGKLIDRAAYLTFRDLRIIMIEVPMSEATKGVFIAVDAVVVVYV